MNGKVLIANRGEIALRIMRACRELGLPSVVVYSEADRNSLPVRLAEESVCIGESSATESYLREDRILSAGELTGATAIHPGYGFLSENAHFAELCTQCGFLFIGPTSSVLRQLGDKTRARETMKAAGVPVIPGSDGALNCIEDAVKCAEKLGYPVILKAALGGGGRGMRVVTCRRDMGMAWEAARIEAERAFGDGTLFMEKFLINPKHVEVQLVADEHGNVFHCGERDCSMQRHHQKLIEESPCAILSSKVRSRLLHAAVKAARSVGYTGVGTVEFLLDGDKFYFMEINARIQVEHPVTEMATGLDLVKLQLKVAFGEKLRLHQDDIKVSGHTIEVRVNAEDPVRGFAPCPGRIVSYCAPGGPGVRVDSHVFAGFSASPYYDSLLGKLIVHADSREECLERLHRALWEYKIEGVTTTIPFAERLLKTDAFIKGNYGSSFVDDLMLGKVDK